MKSQTQSPRVFSKEPGWLLAYRKRNAAIVTSEPLKKSKYSNLAELNNILELPLQKKSFVAPKELERLGGIRVLDWPKALKEFEPELKIALESERSACDQFEAFVNANFNSGFVLVIEKSMGVNSLVHWQTSVSSGAVGKTVVLVKPNCQNVHLLERVSSQNGRLSQTVLAGKNSKIFWVQLMDLSGKNLVFRQCILEKKAFLHSAGAWQKCSFVKSHSAIVLSGAESQSVHREWVLAGQTERLDLKWVILHAGLASKSNSVFKAVLADSAYSILDAMIKILPSGQQSSSRLETHGVLLSPNASSNNIPCLEIEADDIKAGHAATVCRLDDESLFYLRSRGITDKKARQMAATGFLEALIHELPVVFWPVLTESIENKWEKLNQTQ
ncbi:MAG: SufD family Fe-S cluster assembly protein [Candidatus Micrarchaeota archaeon]